MRLKLAIMNFHQSEFQEAEAFPPLLLRGAVAAHEAEASGKAGAPDA